MGASKRPMVCVGCEKILEGDRAEHRDLRDLPVRCMLVVDNHCADVRTVCWPPGYCITLARSVRLFLRRPALPRLNIPYLPTPVHNVVIPSHLTSHSPSSSD